VTRSVRKRRVLLPALAGSMTLLFACGLNNQPGNQLQPGNGGGGGGAEASILQVPEGFRVEKVVGGLTYPTSLTWDDQGRMYVAEAGNGLYVEQKAPIRILQVDGGTTVEVANLSEKGLNVSMVGMTWHDGAFYVTHRAKDLTGAVSRVTKDGQVTQILSGVLDSQAEHQVNDIKVGPDGRMYMTAGPAGNAGVISSELKPWLMKSPNVHTTTPFDLVLTGRNFQMDNVLTPEEGDTTLTGAYVPFGTQTRPGQRIKGVKKAGGTILVFDPKNAEATVKPYAWGFRNLIGIAWNRQTGEMYASQNGYDIRGARPVQDEFDPTYRIRENAWYGVPDFSAALEPLTNPKFEPPDQFQAEVFVNGQSKGKTLGFVIDHEASGLTPPDKSLVVGLHPVNSSPSMLDVAPSSWGSMAGQLFIAEWGDLAPPTNPLRQQPAGYRVVRLDPTTGTLTPFVQNPQPGPASKQGVQGRGLDRPFDVKFGPDGAMYIVDYGVVTINPALKKQGEPPYDEKAGTGAIWKVTRQ
jgi:glucose/arabinose dehydrogenase